MPSPAARHPAAKRANAALGLCLPLLLAGCGPEINQFAPVCPVPSIPRDFNDLRRYRGTGRDLVDLVLEGRVIDIQGSCRATGEDTVTATIAVGVELARGPAAPDGNADLAYFVAVSEGDRILDKQVYRVSAEFPANTDRLRLVGDSVELRLPVTAQKSAAAYRISVGFELTPAQVEFNRTKPR